MVGALLSLPFEIHCRGSGFGGDDSTQFQNHGDAAKVLSPRSRHAVLPIRPVVCKRQRPANESAPGLAISPDSEPSFVIGAATTRDETMGKWQPNARNRAKSTSAACVRAYAV
ncbi:hypothetical protein Trco_007276 [Trichoderma cornu-damae]|uniref:Uncharacterized protein n=1 Tax=Trichoderma cornu-damae TaxID=654480 RepID=A0A9P8QE79_9HYPO|nr:hypothetical protein Trco_007276 [Trichoderma cornu-damae]